MNGESGADGLVDIQKIWSKVLGRQSVIRQLLRRLARREITEMWFLNHIKIIFFSGTRP